MLKMANIFSWYFLLRIFFSFFHNYVEKNKKIVIYFVLVDSKLNVRFYYIQEYENYYQVMFDPKRSHLIRDYCLRNLISCHSIRCDCFFRSLIQVCRGVASQIISPAPRFAKRFLQGLVEERRVVFALPSVTTPSS